MNIFFQNIVVYTSVIAAFIYLGYTYWRKKTSKGIACSQNCACKAKTALKRQN